MTQLLTSWLTEDEMEQTRLAEAAAIAATEKRIRLERLAAERMAEVVERWGLGALLGLPENDVVTERRLYRSSALMVSGMTTVAQVSTIIADWGNIRVTLTDVKSNHEEWEEWGVTLEPERFKVEFLTMVKLFAANRATLVALRERRLPVARKLSQLAKLYEERKATYVEMRRQWAERWTKELWAPWLLWRVWYLPVYGVGSVPDEERGPEVIMCLEGPEEILAALAQFPTATVRRVESDGAIVEMEIPSFIEAEPAQQDTMTIGQELAYHRKYRGLEVVVNVPAIEGREAEPAPMLGSFEEYVKAVDDTLWTMGVEYHYCEGALGRDLLSMTPEMLIQVYESAFD